MGASAIVGRERELSAVNGFLELVGERTAGLHSLVFEGEAGIGKTTLWSETIRRAREHGLQVLVCQPGATEAKLALSSVGDLVECAPDDALRSLPPLQRHALEVALLRRDPGGADPEPRVIATAVRSLLDHLCLDGPLLIAIDDVHWLDHDSANALTFALRRLSDRPIGCVFTVRVGHTPRIDPDRLGQPDATTRVAVGPLSMASLHQILRPRVDGPLTRPMLTQIHRRSAGNPLFAFEIAHAAAALQHGVGRPASEEAHALLSDRIHRLPAATRDALLACAATGTATTSVAAEAALAPAEVAGIVRIDDRGRVRFTHPLFAAAVYDGAPRAQRRQMHERLARATEDPEERAHHLALAATGPDEVVAAALEEAAPRARARGAWDSCAELWEHAARLTPASDPDAARRRLLTAADRHIHAGDRPRARALVARILDDQVPPPLRAQALNLLGDLATNDEHYLSAKRHFLDSLACDDDPGTVATAQFGLAYVESSLGNWAVAADHAHAGLAAARCSGDESVLAQSLALVVVEDFLCGRGVDWDALDRSLELEDPNALITGQRRPSQIAALVSLYAGRHGEARERLTALCARARERGDESDLAFTLLWFSWLETRAGDLPKAEELAAEGAYLAEVTGSRANQVWMIAQQAFLHAHRGDAERTHAANARAAAGLEEVGTMIPVLWLTSARALLANSLGDFHEAWDACRPLVEQLEQTGLSEPVPAFFLPEAIEALVGIGDLDRADRVLAMLLDRGRELDRVWALATGQRCLALLRAARGDVDGALAAAADALTEHERIELPFDRARALLVRGVIQRRARRRAEARRSLEQALGEFERIGTPRLADRAREELARTGQHRSGDQLTESEQRTAELAASGLTNREIAAALFVSPKTVEANLARAYRKLEISSRAELGARMGQPRTS